VTGVVVVLRPHAERLASEFEPHLSVYLANGMLPRYVAQGIE
jgi:hypothetical protein